MSDNDLSAMLLGDSTAGSNINEEEVAQVASMLKNQNNTSAMQVPNGNTANSPNPGLVQLPIAPTGNVPHAAPYNQTPQTQQNMAMQQAAFFKALRFVKFIEVIKGKLPEKQKQIVSDLNQKFAHRMINFQQYKEGLLEGIGQMKFKILTEQFALMQHKSMMNADATNRQQQVQQLPPGYPPSVYANVQRPVASPLADAKTVGHVGSVNVTVRPTGQRKSIKRSGEQISDVSLVNVGLLRNRIEAITKQFRIAPADEIFLEFVNLALRERLKNAAEELVSISKKRIEDNAGFSFSFVTTSDTKSALRDIEKREREIAERRSAEEKQRLREAARANKKDKKDNKILQDKLNKVEQEEEAKRTNDTAMIAIGNARVKKPRKNAARGRPAKGRPRTSSPAPASPANLVGTTTSTSAGAHVSKITYRDAMIFAERDTEMRLGTSAIAQKCFLGKETLKYSKKT